MAGFTKTGLESRVPDPRRHASVGCADSDPILGEECHLQREAEGESILIVGAVYLTAGISASAIHGKFRREVAKAKNR